jgi:neutral ceramidase
LIQAEFDKSEITPHVGIRLGGFASRLGKPSNAVHDPLIVRAIFLSCGAEEALLISADVLGVYRGFADGVKGAISKRTGIRSDRIILAATHTHSGPETIVPMWPNTFPYSKEEKGMLEDWFDFFKDKIVEVSTNAYKNASSVSIKAGYFYARKLTLNRSYEDGPLDDQLSTIIFNGRNSRFLITNYACHPVCNSDLGISADYPGELSLNLLKMGYENFFATGAAGNINPVELGMEAAQKLGSELSYATIEALNESHIISSDKLKVTSKSVNLHVINVDKLQEAEAKFKEVYRECAENLENPDCHVRLLYADEELEVAKDHKTFAETTIKVFSIGNEIVFISIPGELFVEFGLGIKEAANELGYRFVVISTYSDDYIGYIPAKKAFELGTYEARLARWSRITEKASEEMYGEVLDCLRSLGT